jgi:hypothetical protein
MITEKQVFEARVVRLDHASFHGCTFLRCTLVYAGLGSYTLEDCQLVDCRWSFEGPAANLLQLLRTMYASDGGKQIVENVFANIRAGAAASPLDLPTGSMRH